MRRLLRVLRVILLVVLAAEAFYLVAANAALLLVPGLVNRTPERLLIHFQAFSPFPGCVLVKDFSIRAQDRFAQWQLGVGRAFLWMDPRDLKESVFHVRKVSASEVSFQLRRKLRASEVTPELVKLQPRIEGLGPVGLRQDRDYPNIPPPPHTWTIRMDDVDAKAKELWLDTVRYEGPLHADGAWSLHLDREAWIGPAQVELEGGTVSRGQLALASDVRGRVDARVDAFPVRGIPGDKILDYLDLRTHVSAQLTDVGGMARMLGASKALGISGEPARVTLDGGLANALLDPGTKLTAEIPRARMKVGGLTASGAATAVARVSGRGRGAISIEVKGDDLTLTKPSTGERYVRGGKLELSTRIAGRSLRALKAPAKASLSLSGAEVPHLAALNDVIPSPLQLQVLGGQGTVAGNLDIDLARGVGSGGLKLAMRQAALRQAGDSVLGDIDVELKASGVRPDLRKVTLSGSRVALRQMEVTSAPEAGPWSGEVNIPEATLDLNRREALRAKIDVRFQDARPLFRALLARTPTPKWAAKLLAPSRVRGSAELGFGKGLVRVEDLDAQIGRAHVMGVARLTQQSRDGAARINSGFLSAGVELRNGRRSVKLLPSRGWFEREQERVIPRAPAA
jgi:hypothetical protein